MKWGVRDINLIKLSLILEPPEQENQMVDMPCAGLESTLENQKVDSDKETREFELKNFGELNKLFDTYNKSYFIFWKDDDDRSGYRHLEKKTSTKGPKNIECFLQTKKIVPFTRTLIIDDVHVTYSGNYKYKSRCIMLNSEERVQLPIFNEIESKIKKHLREQPLVEAMRPVEIKSINDEYCYTETKIDIALRKISSLFIKHLNDNEPDKILSCNLPGYKYGAQFSDLANAQDCINKGDTKSVKKFLDSVKSNLNEISDNDLAEKIASIARNIEESIIEEMTPEIVPTDEDKKNFEEAYDTVKEIVSGSIEKKGTTYFYEFEEDIYKVIADVQGIYPWPEAQQKFNELRESARSTINKGLLERSKKRIADKQIDGALKCLDILPKDYDSVPKLKSLCEDITSLDDYIKKGDFKAAKNILPIIGADAHLLDIKIDFAPENKKIEILENVSDAINVCAITSLRALESQLTENGLQYPETAQTIKLIEQGDESISKAHWAEARTKYEQIKNSEYATLMADFCGNIIKTFDANSYSSESEVQNAAEHLKKAQKLQADLIKINSKNSKCLEEICTSRRGQILSFAQQLNDERQSKKLGEAALATGEISDELSKIEVSREYKESIETMRRAKNYEKENKFSIASELYERIKYRSPFAEKRTEILRTFKEALTKYDDGDYEKAEALFDKISDSLPITKEAIADCRARLLQKWIEECKAEEFSNILNADGIYFRKYVGALDSKLVDEAEDLIVYSKLVQYLFVRLEIHVNRNVPELLKTPEGKDALDQLKTYRETLGQKLQGFTTKLKYPSSNWRETTVTDNMLSKNRGR